MSQSSSSRWCLSYCKAKNEARAELNLKNQDIVSFFPVFTTERIVRGKRTQVTEPLFPNYIFAEVPEKVSYTTIRSTRGVIDFVRHGASPVVVPSELVYELMLRSDTSELNEMLQAKTQTQIRSGEKVLITQGQYKGLEAIYDKADGLCRSMLFIKLLQQDVPVSIDNKCLQLHY